MGLILYSLIPPEKSFDKNEWLTNSEERIFMVDDMLSDYNDLEGMTKDEVIAILGEDYLEEYSNENHLCYYLGFGGGFAIDPSTLEISFENDIVSDVYYYEH